MCVLCLLADEKNCLFLLATQRALTRLPGCISVREVRLICHPVVSVVDCKIAGTLAGRNWPVILDAFVEGRPRRTVWEFAVGLQCVMRMTVWERVHLYV